MLFKVRLILFCMMLLGAGVTTTLRAQTVDQIKMAYQPDMSKGLIYVSKDQMRLTLFGADGKVVLSYPIACGKARGHKQGRGDYRTPEGLFTLQSVQDASDWGHDFHDGHGYIKNAYGPWFMRLKTGFDGIGIHGTHDPASIGSRATEGCIRVENHNLDNLRRYVREGMSVIVGPEDGHLYAGLGQSYKTPAAAPAPVLATAASANPAPAAARPAAQKPARVYDPHPKLEVVIACQPQPLLPATHEANALVGIPMYIIFNNI